MSERRRVFLLIFILICAALITAAVSITLLYRTALEQQRARLMETAQSQARLLEAVGRFDATYSTDYPGGAVAATLSQMRESHENYMGFGETGEFTLAEAQGGHIVFLLSHRHADTALPRPVPFESDLAEPMHQALLGRSGTIIGLDYRGETVLAAYEPVEGLGWGSVAKIDLAEVRAPFVRAGLIAVGVALVLVALGATLFFKVTNPLIESLEESREHFRTTLYSIGDAVLVADAEGTVQQMNPLAKSLTGWGEAEAQGQPVTRVFEIVNEETRARVKDPVHRVLREDRVVGLANHTLLIARDGTERPIADSGAPIRNKDEEITGVVLVFRDQTEERAAQKALHREYERAQQYLDIASVMMVALDREGRIQLINRKGCEILGYEEEELIGEDWFATCLPAWVREEVRDIHAQNMAPDSNLVDYAEVCVLTKSSEERLVAWHNTVIRDDDGKVTGSLSSGQDITERVRAEEAERRANRAYRVLSASNQALVHATKEIPFLEEVCQHIVEQGGYRLAWVGFANQDAERSIQPVASAGYEAGFLESLQMSWGDSEHGRNPAGTAIRTGENQVMQNILAEPAYRPWRDEALKRRYAAVIALPLRNAQGKPFGALTIDAAEPDAFDREEVALLEELAGDLAFGIEALRDQERREAAEQALRESEERFKLIFEHAPDAIYLNDLEGTFVEGNRMAEALSGYQREELLGKSFPSLKLLPKKQLPRATAILAKNALGQSTGPDEFTLLRKDGPQVEVEIRTHPVKLQNQRLVMGIARDITDRKQAEEALRESEARLRFALESSGIIFATVDSDLRYTWVYNPHPAFDPEEIIGRRDDELIEAENTEAIMAIKRDVLATGEGLRREFKMALPDGARWYDFIAEPIKDASGQTIGVSTAGIDITERRKAEEALRESQERFRLSFENSRIGMALATLEGKFIAANERACDILGYKRDELLATDFLAITHPQDRDRSLAEFDQLLAGDSDGYSTLKRYLHKDGHVVWGELAVSLIRSTSGEPAYVTAQLVDITERKRAEEALQESEAKHRHIAENLPGVVFEFVMELDTGEGHFTHAVVNEFVTEKTGFTASTLLNEVDSYLGSILPEDFERYIQVLQKSAREMTSYSIEFRIRRPTDGEIIWLNARATPQRVPDNRVSWTGIAIDITERKRAEEALRASERRYRELFDNLPVGIFQSTPAGRYRLANPTFASMLGYDSPKEVVSTIEDITDLYVDPADREEVNRLFEEHGQLSGHVIRHRHRNGQERWMSIFARCVYDDAGAISYYDGFAVDVTKQRQAERALRESEARFRAIIEQSVEGITLYDREGVFVEWNRAMERFTGLTREEVLGQFAWDVHYETADLPSPLTYEEIKANTLELLEMDSLPDEGLSYDYGLHTPSGEETIVNTNIFLIAYQNQEYFVNIVRDVTEQKKAEEAEREQRALAEALRATAEALTGTLALDEVLELILNRVKPIVPYDAADVMLIDESDNTAHISSCQGYPADVPEEDILAIHLPVDDTYNLREAARTSQPVIMSDVQVTEDWVTLPETRWIRSNICTPILSDEKVIGFLSLHARTPGFFNQEHAARLTAFANQASIALQNAALYQELETYSSILEQAVDEATLDLQRQLEEQQTILHNTPDVILRLGPDGAINTANPAFYTLFGYDEGEAESLPVDALVADDMRPSLDRTLRLVQDAHHPLRIEAVARRKDQTTFDAEFALAPVVDEGALLGVICNIRDISVMKELDRLKDQFLSTAAHELRTPLVSVQGFSEILLTRDLEPDRQRRYLTTINEQAVQLRQIIDDLLDVSRLEAGRKLDIQPEPVDVDGLIAEALEPYRETANDHDIVHQPLDDPLTVQADPFRLMQVLRNLMSNAVKYSPEGGTVTVRSQRLPDYLLVSVEDEGIGMTPDQLAHLFEAFWRADEAEKVAGGTGLGLRISQLIIAGHGGGIWAESQVGMGTTFYFTLPLNDAEETRET